MLISWLYTSYHRPRASWTFPLKPGWTSTAELARHPPMGICRGKISNDGGVNTSASSPPLLAFVLSYRGEHCPTSEALYLRRRKIHHDGYFPRHDTVVSIVRVVRAVLWLTKLKCKPTTSVGRPTPDRKVFPLPYDRRLTAA